jgi:hypothetical protein
MMLVVEKPTFPPITWTSSLYEFELATEVAVDPSATAPHATPPATPIQSVPSEGSAAAPLNMSGFTTSIFHSTRDRDPARKLQASPAWIAAVSRSAGVATAVTFAGIPSRSDARTGTQRRGTVDRPMSSRRWPEPARCRQERPLSLQPRARAALRGGLAAPAFFHHA